MWSWGRGNGNERHDFKLPLLKICTRVSAATPGIQDVYAMCETNSYTYSQAEPIVLAGLNELVIEVNSQRTVVCPSSLTYH